MFDIFKPTISRVELFVLNNKCYVCSVTRRGEKKGRAKLRVFKDVNKANAVLAKMYKKRMTKWSVIENATVSDKMMRPYYYAREIRLESSDPRLFFQTAGNVYPHFHDYVYGNPASVYECADPRDYHSFMLVALSKLQNANQL